MAGIDGNGNGPHGGHGLHQRPLVPAGDVGEPCVISGVVVGVVVARLVILEEQRSF